MEYQGNEFDWRVMSFSPRIAGGSCLDRARRFLDLASNASSKAQLRDDSLRMAIVMAVAAVDTYMHVTVLGAIGSTDSTTPSKSLRGLDMDFGDLVDLADAAVEARREERDIRPRVQVKNALHRRLLRETFQSADQVSRAMAFAGVTHIWKTTSAAMNESPEEIKARLNRLVHRRNQIVHEGDLKRQVRPRGLSFNAIEHNSVVEDIAWVESLLDAFESRP